MSHSTVMKFLSGFRALIGAVFFLSIAPAGAVQLPTESGIDDMSAARSAAAHNDPAEALSRYLRVLSRNPRDLEALTGAGRASLDIGDPNAAISFYGRAEDISPRNGSIKAGLGSAMVQLEQPKAALKLFDEAVGLGVPVTQIATDRGLAYDLRGESKRAQVDYLTALQTGSDPETLRRLALSQAISGDRPGALATLDPLLRKQDKAAWRTQVFVYAITGDPVLASTNAHRLLPQSQADALTLFLNRMAKLKPGQQAAAAVFGHFPSDGKTYTREQLFADADGLPVAPTPPQTKSLPRSVAGPIITADNDELGDGIGIEAKRVRPSGAAASPGTPPLLVLNRPYSGLPAPDGKKPVDLIPPPPKMRADVAAMSEKECHTSWHRGRRVTRCVTSKAETAAAQKDCKTKMVRQGRHMVRKKICTTEPAASDKADQDEASVAPKADENCTVTGTRRHGRLLKSTKCAPALASADKKEEAKSSSKSDEDCKPVARARHGKHAKKSTAACETKTAARNNSDDTKEVPKSKGGERYWVQVATGAYKPDLGKEWTKLKGKYPALLGRYSPSSAPLRRTNRLLIGPFASKSEAQEFVNTSGRSGFGTSLYVSSPGTAVERVN
jgi:Flp pilus assembly protein TadD